jgi:hypothetical protein
MNAASTVLRSSRRFAAVLIGPLALALMTASPAWASTTTPTPVTMNFAEPKAADFVSGCAVLLAREGLCGVGDVVPYGHATETIVFGFAVNLPYDVRTVTVSAGTIVMQEHLTSFFVCAGGDPPGACEATLADQVVGGTGLFRNATGSLSGTVTGTGPQSHIQLAGTITTG